ncbi:MAG: hypothetical protein GY755_16890 [Chloroflexi bacterium]|nr:hypothetical protein [Chloroflexota bacterium]
MPSRANSRQILHILIKVMVYFIIMLSHVMPSLFAGSFELYWNQYVLESLFLISNSYFKFCIGIFKTLKTNLINDFENNNNGITLKLDTNWWLNEFKNITDNGNAIYCDTIDSVCEEINESKLNLNLIQQWNYYINPNHIQNLETKNNEINNNSETDNVLNDNDIVTPYSPPINIANINSNDGNMSAINLDSKLSNNSLNITAQTYINLVKIYVKLTDYFKPDRKRNWNLYDE